MITGGQVFHTERLCSVYRKTGVPYREVVFCIQEDRCSIPRGCVLYTGGQVFHTERLCSVYRKTGVPYREVVF